MRANALVVLTAEKGLIQAGMQAEQVDVDGDDGWQSNILRNTEQVALLIADIAGKIGIETQTDREATRNGRVARQHRARAHQPDDVQR